MNYIVIGFYLALGVTVFGLATLALVMIINEIVRWRHRKMGGKNERDKI